MSDAETGGAPPYPCDYCQRARPPSDGPDGDLCGASVDGTDRMGAPTTYECTRPDGHDGPCAACGFLDDEHPIATET